MKPIVWVHGDCLSPTNPALETYADAPAVFVWDEALLAEYEISFKRVVFMYECLLEMPNVEIRRGDVVEELIKFAQEHGADTVATAESVAPKWLKIVRRLHASGLTIRAKRVTPFIETDAHLDLKRFSRYWRTAQKYAYDYS